MERWRDGEMERWRDGEMDRQTDNIQAGIHTDRETDRQIYRWIDIIVCT